MLFRFLPCALKYRWTLILPISFYLILLFAISICLWIFLPCRRTNKFTGWRVLFFNAAILIAMKCMKPSVTDSYKIPYSSTLAILRDFFISALWFWMLLILNTKVGMYCVCVDGRRWQIREYILDVFFVPCNILVHIVFLLKQDT